jgi:hypothetical protein
MLVLLMREIYELCHWDGLRWHDIHTKFREDWFRNSGNIKVLTQQFDRLYVGITDARDL